MPSKTQEKYAKDLKNGKPVYRCWGDKPVKYPVRADAKFSYDYVEPTSKLVAAGMTEKDLAFVFNTTLPMIQAWKKRYPQFKNAFKAGKEGLKRQLVAQGARRAMGYDYTVVKEQRDKDGKLKGTTTIHTHQPADSKMLEFMLINIAPEDWKRRKQMDITEKKLIVHADAKLEGEQIHRLAGKLLAEAKKIESNEVNRDARSISEDNSEESS